MTTSSYIHPSAFVAETAVLGNNCSIGRNVIIEDGVQLGDDCKISDQVIIRSGTCIGNACEIYPYSVIGEVPQDRSFQGEVSGVEIGDRTILREFTTVHRGTGAGKNTCIGSDSYLMTYAHIGHNAVIGDHVTLANSVQIAGHVIIEDHVTIGGLSAIHQNCRVGAYAMVGGMTAASKDLPPYLMYMETPAIAWAPNRHGLKKANFPKHELNAIFEAFKIIYHSKSSIASILAALDEAQVRHGDSKCIEHMISFIRSSKRGIKLARHKS